MQRGTLAASPALASPALLRRRPRPGCGRGFGALCSVERSYSCSRSLTLPLRDDSRWPVEGYLRHTERVVLLSFPDQARRQRLSADTWRVRLLPFQLLWFTLRVACSLRTWADEAGALHVCGREMTLSGLPAELQELASTVVLRVDGQLLSTRAAAAGSGATMQGAVRLRIAAKVPEVVAFVPGVDGLVQRVLEQILYRIEASLRTSLPLDYSAWTREQQAKAAQQGQT